MTDAVARILCRDRLNLWSSEAARCLRCGSPRSVDLDAAAGLEIAHVDYDAFYASVEKRDKVAPRSAAFFGGGLLSRQGFCLPLIQAAGVAPFHRRFGRFQRLAAPFPSHPPSAIRPRPARARSPEPTGNQSPVLREDRKAAETRPTLRAARGFQASRNKIQAGRNKIQAGWNKIQIRRNEFQIIRNENQTNFLP